MIFAARQFWFAAVCMFHGDGYPFIRYMGVTPITCGSAPLTRRNPRLTRKAGLLFTLIAGLLSLGAVSCTTISSSPVVSEATPESYAQSGSTNGVVILAVNWSRHWGCGEFENAEIMSIGFDRLPVKDAANEERPEVFLDGPPRLLKQPGFFDYALLLKPGEYALTSFDIKVARSITDVGFFKADRLQLLKDGKPIGGSFDVKAGEVVYIGNFYLDCNGQPMLWRYYTEGRANFKAHMNDVKQKYPCIDPDKVNFRLFRTATLGRDYELPP
jgi:hypothetical protein